MITTKESVGIDRDGTGYTLTVKKNYESYAQKLKDMAKEEGGSSGGIRPNAHRRRLFAYTFTIMDLRTRLYLAYGSSMKSERAAFDGAVVMLECLKGILHVTLSMKRDAHSFSWS